MIRKKQLIFFPLISLFGPKKDSRALMKQSSRRLLLVQSVFNRLEDSRTLVLVSNRSKFPSGGNPSWSKQPHRHQRQPVNPWTLIPNIFCKNHDLVGLKSKNSRIWRHPQRDSSFVDSEHGAWTDCKLLLSLEDEPFFHYPNRQAFF